ncbi:unnamed protein product [Leptidea sinapis]|uniref:Uncharacterized protein n=1 Tax=Leptidea sinapis TaxID=189913 RepID=A0A5E4QYX3_9NEOP|nr:unnamed protein product [Leptidea sinapis]
MQAAPTRYVSSSELYSTDEVELLLEEIRELEPSSCRAEDVQDFEIAGSGGAGGRSPAATDASATERSWDSHAHYSRPPPPRPQALAPVYCRLAHLATPPGALTLLLVLQCLYLCVECSGSPRSSINSAAIIWSPHLCNGTLAHSDATHYQACCTLPNGL